MPFVDLNSLKNGGSPAAAPTDNTTTNPVTTATPSSTLLPLPDEQAMAVPNTMDTSALPPLVSSSPVQTQEMADTAANVAATMEADMLATTPTGPAPGTIEFDPTPVAAMPDVAPVAELPVVDATPAPEPTIVAEPVIQVVPDPQPIQPEVIPQVVELPVPEAPASVMPMESVTAEVVPEVTTPEPTIQVVPVDDVPTAVDTTTDANQIPAEQPTVVSFSSTPDAEDPDKPPVVKSPEIKIAEGVEVKSEQGGIREIVGPGFDEPAPSAVQQIAEQNIDDKLASIGNVMATPVVSSTPDLISAPPMVEMSMSETDTTVTPVVSDVGVAQIPAEVTPMPVTTTTITDTQTMAADPLDLSAVSAVPTAPSVPVDATMDAATLQSPNSTLPSKTYGLNELLMEAINMHASDLHLTVGYRATARVDGKLTSIKSSILDNETIKGMIAEVVKGREMGDLEAIRDYDLSYQLPDGSARFRVNIFKQQESLAMVLRLIPTQIQSVESLKLPPIVKEFRKFSSGLVLFTGPTGSGKSTTIASILNEINLTEPKHIVTVEDPIEYVYPKGTALVDQREIFTDTASWGDALRSVLRQDPDVVLIGEMRDLETISAAIRVAETGHLVFATLHTNSAAQSIDRIIDVFPEGQQTQIRTQLATVVQAIVSQRLVPVASGGRRVSVEILIATPAVRNAIRDDKVYQIDNMIQTSAELGMISMEKSLVALVREGQISTEQAEAYANKPGDVLTLLGQNR